MRTRLWSLVPRRRALTRCTLVLLAAFVAGGARAGEDQDREDFFGSYTHRIEGVTVGLGDAGASNAASQIIDPWPAYAHDRHILSESQRMIGAIQRYQTNSGAKPLQVRKITPSQDGGGAGAQEDAAADTAKSPSPNASAGE